MRTLPILGLGLALAACTAESAPTPAANDATESAPAASPTEATKADATTTDFVLDNTPWNACVAAVRGALEIDGISDVQIEAGEKPFKVTYDPNKVTKDQILAALKESGESAKLAQ